MSMQAAVDRMRCHGGARAAGRDWSAELRVAPAPRGSAALVRVVVREVATLVARWREEPHPTAPEVTLELGPPPRDGACDAAPRLAACLPRLAHALGALPPAARPDAVMRALLRVVVARAWTTPAAFDRQP